MFAGPSKVRKGPSRRRNLPFGYESAGSDSPSGEDDNDEAEGAGADELQTPDDQDEDNLEDLGAHSHTYDSDFHPDELDQHPSRPQSRAASTDSQQPNDNPPFSGAIQPGVIFGGQGNFTFAHTTPLQKEIEEAREEFTNLLTKLTISRDLTEAGNVEKERLLAIEDESFLEKVGAQAAALQSQPQGNHALQDYQMQLMLLEQQNKKRLLMARQEQDEAATTTVAEPGTPSSLPTLPAPIPSRSDSYRYPNPLRSGHLDDPFNLPPPPPRDLYASESGSFADSRQYNTTSFDSMSNPAPAPLDPTRAGPDERELVNKLRKQIEDLERDLGRLKHATPREPRPPRFLVLHVVEGEPKTYCLQPPTWTFGKRGKLELKAESPLANIDTHLRRNDDISFLVYKFYSTPWINNTDLAESLESGVLPSPESSLESIEIRSEDLRLAFDMFLKVTRSDEDRWNPSIPAPFRETIQAPYLFWYRARGQGEALTQLSPKYQTHMKILLDWIETNYAGKYAEFDRIVARGRISHEFTEYLFHPGDVVVTKDRDKPRAYRLTAMPRRTHGRTHHSQAFDKLTRKKPTAHQTPVANAAWRWEVLCWTISYDGQFSRHDSNIELELKAENYNDEVDINELSVIPLWLAGKEVEQQLLQRGRTFWSCRIKKLVSYQGGEEGTLHADGERYMIDNKSYKKLHLEAQKSKRQEAMYAPPQPEKKALFAENMDNDTPPESPDIYLFPPTISGFSLRRKRWTDLVVDKITDVSWNKKAFKHLVADDKTKELVQALVADRIAGERNTDLIEGKGNGLIILLHGGPGTGKTFTAESVAELAEKPLYPVTCGDIGTEPEQVERYLESVLYLGNLWDCVVLLDEADVFLEERGIADLARNALVSVFLRVLEYYDGILILTSNRVGTFDEAFKSRISLALHYPNLKKSQRCKIWKNFLNRLRALKEPNIDYDDIECNVMELAEEELNGRQIRNAITIGRQLAKFQEKDLSYAHLKHVVEVAGQFETYVKKTKEDLTDEQRARLSGWR